MKPFFTNYLLFAVLALGIALTGCAKKADTRKPVDQIKAEVQTMSVNDLEAFAKAYAGEIASKKTEVGKIGDQIKALTVSDLMGDKAKNIKDNLSAISGEVEALTVRYQLYADKFREKGGDVSKIQISQS